MNIAKFILKIDQDLNSPDALLLLSTHYKQLSAQEKELFVLALMGKTIELNSYIKHEREQIII
ncbi:hypothetical protein [Pasteurella canis]|uniref:hypothetical protein n=1 Tax=Pasteurella canis TaxID=753 RepID=UPI001CBE6DD6|nr:hypothetical protein [Pasteurella canis]UAX42452.1 hypothetical protein K7G89_000258 [Pasteurella canis]